VKEISDKLGKKAPRLAEKRKRQPAAVVSEQLDVHARPEATMRKLARSALPS